MKREGKTLKELDAGDKRRLADARNAWKKATWQQRVEILKAVMATEYDFGNRALSEDEVNAMFAVEHLVGALVQATTHQERRRRAGLSW